MAFRFTFTLRSGSPSSMQSMVLLLGFFVLGGCAQHTPLLRADPNIAANAPPAPQLAHLGLQALAEGRASDAATLFSAAVKFDP